MSLMYCLQMIGWALAIAGGLFLLCFALPVLAYTLWLYLRGLIDDSWRGRR